MTTRRQRHQSTSAKQPRIEKLDKNFKAKLVATKDELLWIPATDRRLTIKGLPWFRENRGRFSRLPLRAEKIVRAPVWSLAQSPAGACIAFRSDTTALAVRVTNSDITCMPHMPLTGSHGLSLYCGGPHQWRPWATAVPDLAKVCFETCFFKGLGKKTREFRIYLPLYHALQKLDIGFSRDARILPPSPPALSGPVVFYGTSITQGGCANTAGSDFVSMIGRRLNLDIVNLGFSGNGTGDLEIAELMTEIKASLYVLDYMANVTADQLRRTLPRFVRILQAKRPEIPILLVSSPCYKRYDLGPLPRKEQDDTRDAMIAFYAQRRRAGDRQIHFADGFSLIPYAADAAYVDGVHPTDHGFQMMAEHLAPHIARIILHDN